jgi:hypothetical protein
MFLVATVNEGCRRVSELVILLLAKHQRNRGRMSQRDSESSQANPPVSSSRLPPQEGCQAERRRSR